MLVHAHECGVIHRDVKPSNVLIDGEGRAYLADFGLARSEGEAATLTVDGQLVGTPAYMAPEQARSDRTEVDARTDIYSLGVILYELLTGTRPFVAAPADAADPDSGRGAAAAAAARRYDSPRPGDRLPEGHGQETRRSVSRRHYPSRPT